MEEILSSLGLEPNNEEAIKELEKLLTYLEIKKGDFFLKEENISNRIGFVTKGMFKQCFFINGEEKIRWVLIKNDIAVSLRSFLKKEPSNEYIQAINNSAVFFIARDNWYYLYQKYSLIQQLWIKNIESTIIGYEDRIFDLMAKPARERYENFRNRYPQHAKEIPLQYIASILGIAPQHLSRIRKLR